MLTKLTTEMNKPLIFLFFLLLTGLGYQPLQAESTLNSIRGCEEILSELVMLEGKLDDNNPDSYFDMGYKLLSLQRSNCVDQAQKDKFSSYFHRGAKLGSGKAAMYLGREYYLGRFFPTNDKLAYELFLIGYEKSEKKPGANKVAWISAVNALLLADSDKIEKPDNAFLRELINYIEDSHPFRVSEATKASEKEALDHYRTTLSEIYANGKYGIEKDPSKAVRLAFEYSGAGGYDAYYKEIISRGEAKGAFENGAMQLLMAAQCLDNIYCGENEGTREYAMAYLNDNIAKYPDLETFLKEYDRAPENIRELLDEAYYNPSMEKNWKKINNPIFKPAKANPEWKYMPKSKRSALIREAIKEKESSIEARERLEIFLSMLETGDAEGYYYLGNAYRYGWGLPAIDMKKAMEYYELAIEKNNNDKRAYSQLGQIYDRGYRVKPLWIEPDWKKAAEYYKLSGSDDPVALRNLGEMILFGVGGQEQNRELAKDLFEKSALLGDEKSEFYLGYFDFLEGDESSFSLDLNALEFSYDTDAYLDPIVLDAGKNFVVPVTYRVEENDNYDYLRLFPSKTLQYAIEYYNYSASPKIEGSGVFDVSVNYGRDNSRQIGVFYITFQADQLNGIACAFPLAICWVKEGNK